MWMDCLSSVLRLPSLSLISLLMSSVVVCALLVPSALVPSPWRLAPRRSRPPVCSSTDKSTDSEVDVEAAATAAAAALAACEFAGWDERSLWALEDSVSHFSIDDGRTVLWRRMSLEVPELLAFTPTELRARWLAKRAASGKEGAIQLRDEPPCLEDWVCTAPGRYEGYLHNVPTLRDGSLRATVEHDPEAELLAADPGSCSAEGLDGHRRWVRTRSGALFQLGQARDGSAEATATLGGAGGEALTAVTSSDVAASVGGLAASAPTAIVEAASGFGPAVLAVGALLAAAGTAFTLFGHHVDVSVFIV